MRPRPLPDPRAYPALGGALLFGAGVALAEGAGADVPLPWAAAAGAAALAALALGLAPRRRLVTLRPLAGTLLAALAVVAAGGARTAAHYARAPDHVARLLPPGPAAAPPVTLGGVVAAPPVPGPFGTTLRLRTTTVRTAAGDRPARGLVRVTLAVDFDERPAAFPALRTGDRVVLTGRLRPPPRRRNPADFDGGRYLRRQGVFATLLVDDPAAVRRTGHALGPLGRVVEGVRVRAEAALGRHVPSGEGRGVQRALVLGDRRAVADATEEALARTGLLHLLAVSGLHVLLVGLLLYELLRGLLLRLGLRHAAVEAARAAVTLAVLVVYALLTGATASVVRAVVMAAVVIGGNVLQRPNGGANALGVAALVVLALRPTQLFEAGFGLSFAAVAGLVAFVPRWSARVPRRLRRMPVVGGLVTTALASAAASVATLPLLLFHFGRLPIGGLVLNLVAVPLTSLAFAAGLLTVLAAPVPALAGAFGAAAGALARALAALADSGDRWLGALAYEGYATRGFAVAALVAAVLTGALWPFVRLRAALLVGTLGAGALAAWTGAFADDARPHLDVVFLDVGQGDAALVRLPSGRHLLVDAGPADDRTDAGTRTVLPHLRRYGVRALDALVVTHPHGDHVGGAHAVLDAGVVHTLVHNGDNYPSALRRRTFEAARRHGVRVRTVKAGDTLALDPAVRIEVLGPEANVARPASTNDASVVLRLVYGRTSVLLLGDAQATSEAALVARFGGHLASSVVKVGHHGSPTSSTPPLVGAAGAPGCVAVVSVAAANVYRLPSEDVVGRWRRRCTTVLTSQEGAVWLRSDGERFRRVDWR